MKSLTRRILELGSFMWNLFLSTAGCFVWMRGFNLVSTEKEGREC